MAEDKEIKINVGLDVSVSEDTAVIALKLVELYLNRNPQRCISITRRGDGTEAYTFVSRHKSEMSANNTCLICGDIIPEGRHICAMCELRRVL